MTRSRSISTELECCFANKASDTLTVENNGGEKRRRVPRWFMSRVERLDHVNMTVADLDAAIAFFRILGLEPQDEPMIVEGAFLETVVGIPHSRTRVVMLTVPGGDCTLELSSFLQPGHEPGQPSAPANTLGLRNVAFEVTGLRELVDRLSADGYELVGGVGEYEKIWHMCYVRGPDEIIVALAERGT